MTPWRQYNAEIVASFLMDKNHAVKADLIFPVHFLFPADVIMTNG
jgi:hypothetical protein